MLAAAVFAAVALGATGDLTQKPGTAGCISDEGVGPCIDGKALDHARGVTVSPEGTNVYVVKAGAIAIFDRNVSSGGLAQKPGLAGCIGSAAGFSGPNPGLCPDGAALDGATSIVVSPDGAHVYVASPASDAVAIFDRDPSTGGLSQGSGSGGCVSETGASPCADGTALDGANSVTVSPDGANVYVASSASKAVAVFDRDPTSGALTQQPGTAGCISETGTEGACVDGVGLNFATSVAVSPDGDSAYVASYFPGAVAILDRDPETGALTQKAGTAGCIGDAGLGDGACTEGEGLDGASSVVVSADGTSAYVASYTGNALAIFDRNPATGALTQKPGTAGCISDSGSDGACVDGTALSRLLSVAISPDGASVYTTSFFNHAVAIFDRDTTSDSSPDPTPPLPSTPPTSPAPASNGGNALACEKAKRNHVKAKQRLSKLKRNDATGKALAKARQKIRQAKQARLRTCG